jgi:predicted O-linked N-acetylglucosamine transferase (SPINDLY family)
MFNVWLNILKEAPKSVLWLMDDNKATTHQLKTYAQQKGADLNRIIFTGRAAHAEYLAKLRMADVFLDNFPYNCGSTARDVLNSGLPIVTKSGLAMVSRMAGSLLKKLDFEDYLVDTSNKYEDLICNLAKNPENKKAQKIKLQINLSKLQNDSKKFTESLENGLFILINR